MPSGFRFSAKLHSSGLSLVAAMLLAVYVLAGSVHEVHHLGDSGEGDCVVCLIGTGGNHALPSPEDTIAATRDDFLSPRFSFTSAFSSSYSRGRLIRAPPHTG